MRDARLIQELAHLGDLLFLAVPLHAAFLEVHDRGARRSRHGGGQGGGEDEAGGEAADEIAERGGAGDVAAHDAEGLAKGAFDQGDAVGEAFALGHAAATGAVHADGMDFVEVGHGTVFLGHFHNLAHRADVTVHGIDALEGDDFRDVGGQGGELGFEVGHIVVLPDHLFGFGVADAFDHGGVVACVGQDHAVLQTAAQTGQSCPVRDITGGEKKRAFLAVQISQFRLQQQVVVVGARDVARAARTSAGALHRFAHGVDHNGVLAHAQIVVGAPNGDIAFLTVHVVGGAGELATFTL